MLNCSSGSRFLLDISFPCWAGIVFSMQVLRFDCGSTFGSIKAFIEKGIEQGTEEASKLESLSVLGYAWGDGASGQYILYIHIYIHMYIY